MTKPEKPDTRSSDPQPADQSNEDHRHREDRRRFIQTAALGTAALTSGVLNPLDAMANAASSQTSSHPSPVKAPNQPKFDHLVVLMMENRSFDHILGRLYSPENPPPYNRPLRGQRFDGVQPWMNNPVSSQYNWLPSIVPVSRTSAYQTPDDDSVGHQYADATMQIGPSSPHMQGFVNNRVLNLGVDNKPPLSAVAAPMEGFSPTEETVDSDRPYAAVSVLSMLANSFAVCDNWFSSLPGPTLVNRSFLHAGTSNNWVSNDHNWDDNQNQTIFNRLGEGEWNIYNGDGTTECLTYIIHPTITWNPNQGNSIDKFVLDASVGALAKYSFIEPEVIGYDNGNPPDDQHPPRDVRLGEDLIRKVYEAVRSSPLWARTLLIVTYDEHGGFFDHVTPPAAVPPHQNDPPGEDGFKFNSLGVRVPAVLISPWIEPGTIYHAAHPVDHTAVIKTLCRRFGLEELTDRDRDAVDLADIFSLRMRPLQEAPVLPEWPAPAVEFGPRPLNDLQRELVKQAAKKYGVEVPPMTNSREAKEFILSLRPLAQKRWEESR